MTQSPDHEARISRLEVRIEEVAADATAADTWPPPAIATSPT